MPDDERLAIEKRLAEIAQHQAVHAEQTTQQNAAIDQRLGHLDECLDRVEETMHRRVDTLKAEVIHLRRTLYYGGGGSIAAAAAAVIAALTQGGT